MSTTTQPQLLDKAGLQHVVTKMRALITGVHDNAETWTDNLTSQFNQLNQRLTTLTNNFNTLLGTDDVTDVIDTFNEVESFLQDVTNAETLTGLLEDMKAEIVGMIPRKDVVYISKYVSGVTVENKTASETSKSDGASIVYNNTTKRLLLSVGAIAPKYYASWGDVYSFGEVSGGGVVPRRDCVYAVNSGDYDEGVDIALWNGTGMVCLHFKELEYLYDFVGALPENLTTRLENVETDLQEDRTAIISHNTRLTALENATPRAITTAEIDAMFA